MIVTERKITRKVFAGNLTIGGGAPITVQSMTTSKTHDLISILPEIERLEESGCQIIRVAVPDKAAVKVLPEIKKRMSVPLVADIHFNYRLALAAIDSGVDKIRINPGNIGAKERVEAILQKAKAAKVPIRIGVNSGSLEKDLLEKYGYPTPESMVESAKKHIDMCLENNFYDIVVSLKSSDVCLMIEANRLFSQEYDFPLHLGVTEAGPPWQGTIKSCIGIGTLLSEGIGDTIRVSLTDDPVQEVRTGFEILKSLRLITRGVNIISCPTCGRIEVDLFKIVRELEAKTKDIKKNVTVAVMGCVVNGPGEAREADIGIACGKGEALLFRKGKIIEKIKESEAVVRLLTEIKNYPEKIFSRNNSENSEEKR